MIRSGPCFSHRQIMYLCKVDSGDFFEADAGDLFEADVGDLFAADDGELATALSQTPGLRG